MSKCNCDSCHWCLKEKNGDMICENDSSEYLDDYVSKDHWCEEYEEK